MKTEVVLQRELSGFQIRQMSKSGFLNASDLVNVYNSTNGTSKRVQHYFDNKNTQSYIDAIIRDELGSSQDSGSENESHKLATFSKRGKDAGVWMHPYLFIDFAMWLSPDFKLQCIKWLYDKLLDYRNDAGDYYKEMMQAVKEVMQPTDPKYYSREADMLNRIIFGSITPKQRDKASEEELKKLNILQKANIKMIQEKETYHNRYVKLNEMNSYL